MRRRGIRRFALEVVFLAGVAAALTVADLRPAAVIALMVVALVVVWFAEWIAFLDEPHYGRGLPPRYYVPHVALPPPRPIEQYRERFPVLQPDDAPTFVASTRQWSAALDEWPVVTGAGEETAVAVPEIAAPMVPLPPPLIELEETVAAGFALDELEAGELEEETDEDYDEDGDEPEEPVAAPPPGTAEEEHELPALEYGPRPQATVVHHVDPLARGGRRRFRRRRGGDEHAVEVLDGPPPDRRLPLRLRRERELKAR